MEGCEKLGRPANSAELYKSQLEAAGFVDVVETKYIWPSNRWPKDRKLKELGMFYILAMDTLLNVNRNVAVGERNFRPRGL
jgi:hypothetical protein